MSLAYLSVRKRELLETRRGKGSTPARTLNPGDLSYLSDVAQLYIEDIFRIFDSAHDMEVATDLKAGVATLTDDIWNVLQILPVHSRLAKEMRNLKVIHHDIEYRTSESASTDLFDIRLSPGKSMCQLLYCLQVIVTT